jgi:CDP-diacylglycerol--serine O-phosphatidyltransferase
MESGPRVSPSSWRYLVPNALTLANIACGFLALVATADGAFERAAYLLVVAIFLDTFDGRAARLLGATSRFGQQLDSFSDAVSFGLAPAFLVLRANLDPLGDIGLSVVLLYVFAGVYRLARFNLTADAHSKGKRTLGVPIPIAGGYLIVAVLMRDRLGAGATAAVIAAMALLMVSRWRLPELSGRSLVAGMLLVGICNYLAVVLWPSWATVGWWNAWNVAILVAAWAEDRRQRPMVPAGS